MPPAQCIESAPRLLCGACAEVGSKRTGKPTFSRVQFAGDERLGRLRIQRECIARRASALGHLGYDQRAPDCADGHLDRVPRPNDLRGLHALAVHATPPTEDGPGRRAARLEHSRRPEPLVDPHLIHGAMIAVARGLPADRGAGLGRETGVIPWLHTSSLLPPLELTPSCAWFERYREESSMASTAKPDKQLAKLDGLLDKAVLAVPPPRDNFAAIIARCTTVATTQRGTVPPTRDPRAAGERHHRSRRRWSARARVGVPQAGLRATSQRVITAALRR